MGDAWMLSQVECLFLPRKTEDGKSIKTTVGTLAYSLQLNADVGQFVYSYEKGIALFFGNGSGVAAHCHHFFVFVAFFVSVHPKN